MDFIALFFCFMISVTGYMTWLALKPMYRMYGMGWRVATSAIPFLLIMGAIIVCLLQHDAVVMAHAG